LGQIALKVAAFGRDSSDTPRVVMVGTFQLMSVLENTLSKLARYDQSSVFSSILTLTVSIASTKRHLA